MTPSSLALLFGGITAGLVVGIAVTVVVTALRRRAERREEERIRRETRHNMVSTIAQVMHFALEASPLGVAVVDLREDLVFTNRSVHELGVVDERHLVPEVYRLAQRVFDDGEPREGVLHPGSTAVGPVFSVAVTVRRLAAVDDRFVVVYATDNSENVRMEAARRDFVANVSHELKTPVGAISLLVETMLEARDDPDTVEYFGNKLHTETRRMSTMISELIGLSKLQGAESLPDPRPVSVDRIIDKAVERSRIAAEVEHIDLVTDAPGGAWLAGDEELLVTAVTNLIANAVNYSPDDTPVSISRAVRGQSVVIRVTDRGIGIAPEDQKRVFERFFRVDKARSRATGGTGLGLAVVKHTVINHGGNVSLWSQPGTGSTFSLEFPVLERDALPDEDVPDQGRFTAAELLPDRD
ncbi:cell wall metabolism sensor histidine kinase WalK [Corynebacterium glyciniphilum]|uniref:sensor histidine kinase n=1 Tax=Corynebacterium glyciniphilum TaxID=1404244 RepID=UPI00264BDCE8|nr:ATP-binding protein [Corynebacterium glyciniphilum]MDN5683994.1 ATP-binding protein [Corynebacterium glyciniphilum]MDN6705407.1 ATP-binding protein [Corynebacterium glyciniphilum]